jgi:hypothetical protein
VQGAGPEGERRGKAIPKVGLYLGFKACRTVDRGSRWFIQDEQPRSFPNDIQGRICPVNPGPPWGGRRPGGPGLFRNLDDLSRVYPVRPSARASIDQNQALSQKPMDRRERNGRQCLSEEPIKPAPIIIGAGG